MKKYILLFLVCILVGCSKNKKLENAKIDFFENEYEISIKEKDNCKNDKELYYENENEKIYLVCIDDLKLNYIEKNDEILASNLFKIDDLKSFFEIYKEIVYSDLIVVYLDNDITDEELDELYNKLSALDINKIEYTSKEDYLNQIREEYPNIDYSDLDMDEILYSTYSIYVNDVSNIENIASKIEKMDKVSEVDYSSLDKNDVPGSVIESFINVLKSNNEYKENKDGSITFNNLKLIKCTDGDKKILYISYKNNKNVDNICN